MAAVAVALVVCMAPTAQAELRKQNLVQLVQSSQSIVAGTVSDVHDGIDNNGIPYTEVTIMVGTKVKGKIQMGEYTFRQFGLLEPRTLKNGKRLLSVTPAEFPKWYEGEYVVAFLYHPAARTGLQTTTGLAQGKLVRVDGKLSNRFNNSGLFDGIQAAQGSLTQQEQSVLASNGPVDADDFLSLVHHMVQDQLIQKGVVK